jgi:DMSO/TMAO reductase YedYZ molybdopterin-dependent catalytic subunit
MAAIVQKRPYRVIAGVGAGAGAALAMLVVMAAMRFLFGFLTVPELMLNTVLRVMGGQAFSNALDNLYYTGRPLLFAVILEGTLLLGVLLGVLYAWLARPNPTTGKRLAIFNSPLGGIIYGLVIGLLLNLLFLPLVDQAPFASAPFGLYAPSVIPLWLGMMILGLVFGVTLQALLPPVTSRVVVPAAATPMGVGAMVGAPVEVAVNADPPRGRRDFLRILGGVALALVGGALFAVGGTIINRGGLADPVTSRQLTDGNSPDGSVPAAEPTAETAAQALPTDTLPPPQPTATVEPTTQPTAEPTTEPTAEPTAEATAAAQSEPSATPAEVAQAPTNTPEPPPPTGTSAPPTATPPPAIMVKEITPNASFYHVSKNFFDPSPKSEGWTLTIRGLVNKAYALTYEELTALKPVEVVVGMMCISNPIGGALIGNTNWKGVRLADLIKKAEPQKGVVDVVMTAVDGYADSIPFQKAMDPNVVLVWEMGGQPLTSDHGFPARLLVPGIYGMKHVKWITGIELVNNDFKGFWQEPSQGWSDPAPVNTMSRIDYPVDGTVKLGKQVLSGVAFAGDRSISKVEISTDGGKTWNEAYVKPPLSGTSWVVWSYEWHPEKTGKYTIQARATDGKGNLQTAKKAEPYPNGATGYHAVSYLVK